MKKSIESAMFILLLTNLLTITFYAIPVLFAQENVPYEMIDEIGTHFELQHFNISITTDTTVHIVLRVSSGIIGYYIESESGATSTHLTLSNLQPSTTHYMYEDSYVNEQVLMSDSNGTYTYTQDLFQFHHVFIQLTSGTRYISEDTTLTENVYEALVIVADDIVLDLNGYSVIGTGWYGIELWGRDNVTIKNGGAISNFYLGIYIHTSENIVIRNNTITSNWMGSIDFVGSSNNLITENTIFNQVWFFGSPTPFYNKFYHNNFQNPSFYLGGPNSIWDDGYPSGGNYWSDYTGSDSNHDGIGDTPYVININNQDNYPLMSPWTPVETTIQVGGQDYSVALVSDTTIDNIVSTKNNLHFDSSGLTGDTGYINVIFPMVNTTAIKVFIDGVKLSAPFPVINTDGTRYFIYFEFTLSTHFVTIWFAPVTATTDIDPDTLNLKSNGEWITAYITLPEGYNVEDIVLETVYLEDIQAEWLDIQDGVCMVKFDRKAVQTSAANVIDYEFEQGDLLGHFVNWYVNFYDITLTVAGEQVDGTPFAGTDTINVIKR